MLVSALPPYIIEPIWQQFAALLPERKVDHPLGCHRPRVPDRVVFEKLVEVLVFGRTYLRIADEPAFDGWHRYREGLCDLLPGASRVDSGQHPES
jgi:hypothetical protein